MQPMKAMCSFSQAVDNYRSYATNTPSLLQPQIKCEIESRQSRSATYVTESSNSAIFMKKLGALLAKLHIGLE